MKTTLRRGLLVAFVLVLLAGFGCGKQQSSVTPDGYDQDEPMTAEEMAVAQQISDAVIYFAYDRYDLSTQSQNVLQQKSAIIRQYPQLSVVVEGHCDERGTEEYNLALGERRARAAYDYLVNLGVSPNQLSVVSKGKMEPAVSGSGEAVWSKNRRDEFKVYKPKR